MADEGMSKSAKRRAAKKARDSAAEEPAKPPEPEVKKAEPAPKAKAKAKAEPAPPAAEPKAKGKAKAAPKAAAEPAPAAPKAAAEPKPKADAKKKADGKAAAKPKAKPKKDEEEESKPAAPPEKTNDFTYTFNDDGKGGDWEVSTGMNAKKAKQKQKQEEKKIMEAQVAKTVGGKAVPGAAAATNTVPGMAGYKPAVDQSLMATPDQIAKIMAAKAPAAAAEEKPKEAVSVAEVKVPEDKVGIIIGPKGATINMIKEKTDVKNINLEGGILRIEGKPEAVAQAEQAVQELLNKGFTSLSYENFKSDAVKVPTNALPDIIGKEGKIIIAIKDALKVEITMPKTSGPPGSGPKRTMVTIAGKADNVEKAKEVVNDIVMYYHHEITHPGEVHEELEIEEWNYRFLIGKAGSELRHTEKNYKVRVRIPRDETPNRNVVVVGEKRNVERARDYMYNVIAKANEPRGRGAADKADDHWGDDDDISGDPELARYMYKRT
jgi:rRNA processing protein Krr1/Pno1